MLFNSLDFYFFLPIVFLLYWFVFRQLRWQNLLIVAASYVFYGWWDWRFLCLIAITTLCSFISGIWVKQLKENSQQEKAKYVTAANIILNLIILGVFKYYNFFIENLAVCLHSLGFRADWPTLNIILPVGISFYTFQALSYSIDVYRGKIGATKDIMHSSLLLAFSHNLLLDLLNVQQICFRNFKAKGNLTMQGR